MNHINNIETLEKDMVKLLSLSLSQPFSRKNLYFHPIRIAEASKSILGLNLESPNKNLVNFINTINLPLHPISNKPISGYESKTVSIYQINDAIIDSNLDEVRGITDSLLQLSDGRHILEYLVELSLKQMGGSLLVVWPIYKAINFIGYSDRESTKNAVNGACQSLIIDKFRASKKGGVIILDEIPLSSIDNLKQLQILGMLHEIKNSNFIRKDLINKSADLFINFFFNEKNKPDDYYDSTAKDVDNPINILNTLDKVDLGDETILCFNALRSISKFLNISPKDSRRFLESASGGRL